MAGQEDVKLPSLHNDIMEAQGLLHSYYTHQKEMDGATRRKQHDNLQKQISSYERLLHHAASRFSRERLYQMLLVACNGIPDISRGPRQTSKYPNLPRTIESLQELRDMVEHFRDVRRKGIQKEEENHVIIFFDSFFSQIKYMKHLKNYFNERIYTCLYQYFYDPLDDLHENRQYLQGHDQNSAHILSPVSSGKKTPNTRKAQSKERLSYAVSELFRLSQNWDELYHDKHEYGDFLEPESDNDREHFRESYRFDLVLRFMPDLLLKASKSVELAKMWWIQANKLYNTPPHERYDKEMTYREKVMSLENKITELKIDIMCEEKDIKRHKEELQALQERQDKSSSLQEKCSEAELSMDVVVTNYNDVMVRIELLRQQLQNHKVGTKKYRDMQKQLLDVERDRLQLQQQKELLLYKYQILGEDATLQEELRPEMIRVSSEVEDRIQLFVSSVTEKKETKRGLEKQLTLLKTNCEKMHAIMNKLTYASSTDTDEEVPSVSHEVSWIHTWDDDSSQKKADGATFRPGTYNITKERSHSYQNTPVPQVKHSSSRHQNGNGSNSDIDKGTVTDSTSEISLISEKDNQSGNESDTDSFVPPIAIATRHNTSKRSQLLSKKSQSATDSSSSLNSTSNYKKTIPRTKKKKQSRLPRPAKQSVHT